MKEISSKVEYKGRQYRIVFNLNVMEAIQDEYGTLDNWGALTDGKAHEGETDIKALIFGLREMLNEAIEIDNEDNGTNDPLLTKKQVGRMLTDIGVGKLTEDMNKLVVNSTKNDNEPKNE